MVLSPERRAHGDTRVTMALLACGFVSAVFFVAADLAGTILTPGYSARAQAISELVEAGAPFKSVVDPLLFAFHALVVPFAIGLHRAVHDARRNPLGPILLGAAGLAGMALTAFFPCDPGCAPFVSLRGTLHIFIAIPMGFAILFAILAFALRFGRDPVWGGFRRYSLASFAAGAVLAVVTVAMAETALVGLVERALTASYLQWYAVMSITAIAKLRGT